MDGKDTRPFAPVRYAWLRCTRWPPPPAVDAALAAGPGSARGPGVAAGRCSGHLGRPQPTCPARTPLRMPDSSNHRLRFCGFHESGGPQQNLKSSREKAQEAQGKIVTRIHGLSFPFLCIVCLLCCGPFPAASFLSPPPFRAAAALLATAPTAQISASPLSRL